MAADPESYKKLKERWDVCKNLDSNNCSRNRKNNCKWLTNQMATKARQENPDITEFEEPHCIPNDNPDIFSWKIKRNNYPDQFLYFNTKNEPELYDQSGAFFDPKVKHDYDSKTRGFEYDLNNNIRWYDYNETTKEKTYDDEPQASANPVALAKLPPTPVAKAAPPPAALNSSEGFENTDDDFIFKKSNTSYLYDMTTKRYEPLANLTHDKKHAIIQQNSKLKKKQQKSLETAGHPTAAAPILAQTTTADPRLRVVPAPTPNAAKAAETPEEYKKRFYLTLKNNYKQTEEKYIYTKNSNNEPHLLSIEENRIIPFSKLSPGEKEEKIEKNKELEGNTQPPPSVSGKSEMPMASILGAITRSQTTNDKNATTTASQQSKPINYNLPEIRPLLKQLETNIENLKNAAVTSDEQRFQKCTAEVKTCTDKLNLLENKLKRDTQEFENLKLQHAACSKQENTEQTRQQRDTLRTEGTALQQTIRSNEMEIEELTKNIRINRAAAQSVITQKDKGIDELKQQIVQIEVGAQTSIREKDVEIAELKRQLGQTNAAAQTKITEKDGIIADLKRKLQQATAAEQQATADAQQATAAANDQRVQILEDLIRKAAAKINELSSRLILL